MRVILALMIWIGLALPGLGQSVLPAPPVGGGTSYEACPVELPDWATDAERTVWGDICETGTFDLFSHAGDAAICAPEDEDVPEALVPWALSARFMTLVLTDPDYVAARPTPSASVNCAWIPRLDLSERSVDGTLWINDSLLGQVTLMDARIDGHLDFAGNHIRGSFWARGLDVARDVRFAETSFEGAVSLIDAKVGGTVAFTNTILSADTKTTDDHNDQIGLDLHRIHIGPGGLFLHGGQFSNVDLLGAQIAGDLSTTGSAFSGMFNANRLSVHGSLLLSEKATFADVNLEDARVGGSLSAIGSTFAGTLNANGVSVGGDLLLSGKATFSDVRLKAARVTRNLEAVGSIFNGQFNADGVHVGGNLFLHGGATFTGVDLLGAQVGGDLKAVGSTFAGLFNADGLSVEGSLFFNGATFASVDLLGAHVGGDLYATDSTFTGPLNGDGVSVGDTVFLGQKGTFAGVSLINANIGGNLEAIGSTFTGPFVANRLSVGEDLLLREGSAFNDVNLVGSEISASLQLHGSSFKGLLNLSDAAMGTLNLWQGTKDPTWGPGAGILLRNAQAEAVQARMGVGTDSGWRFLQIRTKEDGNTEVVYVPVPTDLTGFRYDRLGGLGSGATHDLALIDAGSLIDWVEASVPPDMQGDEGYRPQPYRALETALRNMGAEQAATQVAYARLKHRADTRISAEAHKDFDAWLGQNFTQIFDRFLQYTIGFGVYPERAFYWFLGLVAIGTVLAYRCKELCKPDHVDPAPVDTPKRTRPRFWDALFYSLENAIPLMEPSADHARIEHSSYAVRTYFHIQKVLGFVLASVLIGAVTLGG